MEDVLRGGSCRGGGVEATKSQPLLPIIEEGRRQPTVKLCQEGVLTMSLKGLRFGSFSGQRSAPPGASLLLLGAYMAKPF